jgi:hypothetical protein
MSILLSVAERKARDALRVADQLLPDFVFAHAPDPCLGIRAHSDQKLVVSCKITIPNPS